MEALVWLTAIAATSVLLQVLAVAWVVRRVRRANRVCARTPTAAPSTWLVWPSRAARLHRRLRTAVATARFRPPGAPSPDAHVEELVAGLEARAVAADHRLVAAAGSPPRHRRAALDAVAAEIAEVEDIAMRLAALGPRAVDAGQRTDGLEARVRSLAAARAELDDVDLTVRRQTAR